MILVTGGAGFIGSVLVRRLLEAGHAVRVLDKMYFGSKPLEDVRERIDLRRKDVRLADETDLEGVEAVVHLAAFSNDPVSEFWPALTHRINVMGTRHLASLCAEHGVRRFVLASTASIYDRGYPGEPEVLDEDAPVAPTATYAVSKLAAERALLRLAEQEPAFCPVILRKGTVFGLSPRMRFDLVVNTMAVTALRDGVISVHGDGTIWRPLVEVGDAAEAYRLALEAPEEAVRGRVLNIVGENAQVRAVASAVWFASAHATRSVMLRFTEAKGTLRNYRVSGERAREVLGFAPRATVEEAARKLVRHFCDHPEALDGSERIRGENILWMKHLREMEHELATMGGVV